MNNSGQHPNKPSAKKLRYLRDLAEQTGQSFTYPTTSAAASREIGRLLRTKRTSRADRRREIGEVRDDLATRRGDAARVRLEEIRGYGSNAHWAGTADEDPEAGR